MTSNEPGFTDSLDPQTVRTASKLVLTGVWIVLVLFLLTIVPGLDRLIPATPITFAAVVAAVATALMVALLLYMAPELAALTKMALSGPRRVVEDVASVVYWGVVLVAILVAHSGLAGLLIPFLDGLAWLYDLGFLLLALPVVVIIAARLYATVEPGSDLLAGKFADEDAETETDAGLETDAGMETEAGSTATAGSTSDAESRSP